MRRLLLLSSTAALALAVASPALAAPADVTVRVEGADQTLVPRTALRTTTATVNKDGNAAHNCTGTSAAGALDQASGGSWSGPWFDGSGYFAETIKGETHAFPDPQYWELWINNKSSLLGLCGAELQTGDEVLLLVSRCDSAPAPVFCSNPPVTPLGLSAPRKVTLGAPFTVKVVDYSTTGDATPIAGATVSGGDGPATTDANGNAAVTISSAGDRTLRATASGKVRSASEAVCATNGADGSCDTIKPPPACATSGDDGRCGTRDRRATAANITGIKEGQRFAKGKGPRTLTAKVDEDPSGIRTVKLRLTRTDGKRCTYFSGKRERQVAAKCGAGNGKWFAVGDRADVNYLLPSALPRGRYVFDVNVIDKAYNRDDKRRRGGNRIVFRVS